MGELDGQYPGYGFARVTSRKQLAKLGELDGQYPGYGFAKHKGYPVREHALALAKLGACPAHRRSFGPVRDALGLPPLPPWPAPVP